MAAVNAFGTLNSSLVNVIGQAQNLPQSLGLATAASEKPGRVQFKLNSGATLLTFDAAINEQHGRESQPTTFPVEDGSVISDHIILSAFELTLTGVVSDTPLYEPGKFLAQTFAVAATSLLPPLGIVTAAAAYAAQSAQPLSSRPSIVAYKKLIKLQAGDPNANPPQLPTPFNVLTTYARYPNMVIKSLTFPRDASTSGALIFTVGLQQVQIVAPQYVALANLSNPALASSLKKIGEQEPEEPSAFEQGNDAAQRQADKIRAKAASLKAAAASYIPGAG